MRHVSGRQPQARRRSHERRGLKHNDDGSIDRHGVVAAHTSGVD